ncbi:MAG: alpha-galactosidase [Spirochaetia bacterium]|nr:alpha-galactosidase [Spirochaetia bacterium]
MTHTESGFFGRKKQTEKDIPATPPMGWNSWNSFNLGINEKSIKRIADFMVSSGMRDAGYVYLNLDDGWQVSRDKKGVIQPDKKEFPSGMKALGDYIHSRGLKYGIYTCAGTQTCGKRPGSKGYEKLDIDTYASWGVDYVKVDWCFTEGLDSKTQYKIFRDAIDACGRPMVLSICNWGVDRPWLWGRGIGGLWRTTGDFVSAWDCRLDWGGLGMLQVLDKQIGIEQYNGPGGWNDPDMLQVGNSGLTLEESRAHFSLWCILSAPLLAGNNLLAMEPEFKDILMNREAIEVDQDPMGKQGTRIKDHGNGREVWAKPMADGSWAICLFNRGPKSATVAVEWKDLGFGGEKMKVRDLWAHRDLGVFDVGYGTGLPSHGAALVRVKDATPEPIKVSDIWRINAGGNEYKDSTGNLWSADIGFEGGQATSTARIIKAKSDAQLYVTERWEGDFAYNLPVLPGKYTVTLKFAEVYLAEPGQRIFDIFINGVKVKENFEILKEADGFAKAVDLTFNDIEPKDGTVQVRFVSSVQKAKVCAVEVVRQGQEHKSA